MLNSFKGILSKKIGKILSVATILVFALANINASSDITEIVQQRESESYALYESIQDRLHSSETVYENGYAGAIVEDGYLTLLFREKEFSRAKEDVEKYTGNKTLRYRSVKYSLADLEETNKDVMKSLGHLKEKGVDVVRVLTDIKGNRVKWAS